MSSNKGVLRTGLMLVASFALALFFGVSPASADNGPHVSKAINSATTGGAVTGSNGAGAVHIDQQGADRCASCHRAHTAKSAYLLASASQEALCFTCHGDGGTGSVLNVQSGVQYSAADGTKSINGALRGGGFDAAALGSGAATKDIYASVNTTTGVTSHRSTNQYIPALSAPVTTTSSHLGGGNVIWGNGPLTGSSNPGTVTTSATKLECGSCHDPHGNTQYRILKPVPVGSNFATVTTNTNTGVANATAGIFIKDTAYKIYTTTNYWIAADQAALADTATTNTLGGTSTVDPTPKIKTVATAVDSYEANVSAWCTTCHTRYLAPSGSWGTSSGDAIFTYRHTGDQVGGELSANRNCAQCHVAHGSNAAMNANSAVEYPGGATKSTDSRLLRVDNRGVCLMCHNL